MGNIQAELEEIIKISRDGYNFNVFDDFWILNKDIKVSLGWSNAFNNDIKRSYRLVLAYYAESKSADHTKNMNIFSKIYFDERKTKTIDVDSLISYRSNLGKVNEYYLGALKGFIIKWHELGYPGISQDVISLLNGWKFKGNEKGKAVASMDETNGPLSDIEMQALLDGMLNTYINGQINLYDFSLVSILTHTGRRAIQVVSLKVKDLVQFENGDVSEYFINFPRAKQRNVGWRGEFNKYPITKDLWDILQTHALEVISQIEKITGLNINSSLAKEVPLFPNIKTLTNELSLSRIKKNFETDFHHALRRVCNYSLKKISNVAHIISDRTGEQLILNTLRFRYTLGTNLAREGYGEYVIAEALDHSDIQNTGVYVKNLPDIVERIDKAVALQLAPLAQAFQGVLIKNEEDAIRGNDSKSRVSNGVKNLGSCGSFGFCGALAPIACYTCQFFQPWLDAPHEALLEELITKRNEVMEITNDKKIASVNDRLILAISDVINRCIALKEKNNQGEIYA